MIFPKQVNSTLQQHEFSRLHIMSIHQCCGRGSQFHHSWPLYSDLHHTADAETNIHHIQWDLLCLSDRVWVIYASLMRVRTKKYKMYKNVQKYKFLYLKERSHLGTFIPNVMTGAWTGVKGSSWSGSPSSWAEGDASPPRWRSTSRWAMLLTAEQA